MNNTTVINETGNEAIKHHENQIELPIKKTAADIEKETVDYLTENYIKELNRFGGSTLIIVSTDNVNLSALQGNGKDLIKGLAKGMMESDSLEEIVRIASTLKELMPDNDPILGLIRVLNKITDQEGKHGKNNNSEQE